MADILSSNEIDELLEITDDTYRSSLDIIKDIIQTLRQAEVTGTIQTPKAQLSLNEVRKIIDDLLIVQGELELPTTENEELS